MERVSTSSRIPDLLISLARYPLAILDFHVHIHTYTTKHFSYLPLIAFLPSIYLYRLSTFHSHPRSCAACAIAISCILCSHTAHFCIAHSPIPTHFYPPHTTRTPHRVNVAVISSAS